MGKINRKKRKYHANEQIKKKIIIIIAEMQWKEGIISII